jgi:hypothetical protein
MERMMEKRVNVNFYVELQKSPSETLEMLRTVGESPGQRSPGCQKSKTMLVCFFDTTGIIHFEFVPEGTTVNQTFYVEVLCGEAQAR